ncbi:glucose-1-phosphate cytidylyltransferase [Pajaroellobacter abortibovis]|uniref:Glucose-1-phosphate cytidylyltransferase n=1 Tax=Pajaroellobacter abortibovis TaxID=1882918 RepID=A0A1L6MVU0_9BACT|nr:glucose-1-phosphate cytidylyltransferase [Pajaroellobacter abortibovis]APR99594.1 glucose-1-phosphate cytidylyltransferase [Pajaroellobacter abortibovis]
MQKVVILAGGLGTRLAEETQTKPKPMVEVGERPLLWHIMKYFSHYGFNEFFVALGYKGEIIKRFFAEYHWLSSDYIKIDLTAKVVQPYAEVCEKWRVHLIDTGIAAMTGGRLKRLLPWIKERTFLLTYGDAVSNVNLNQLLKFHRSHGKLATVTAVRPPSRFGGLTIDDGKVVNFTEKPQIGEGWINGGFMVLEPDVVKYLDSDSAILEIDCLERLAAEGQLMAYCHHDFWQCVDTLRDLKILQKMWNAGSPSWKVWE